MTKAHFARAKASADSGVLIHLVCNEADCIFYSDDPDGLTEAQRTVLCAETFFSAMCDGGFASWFAVDHGQLAHCGPISLRRLGLGQFAELAEQALKIHHDGPLPEKVCDWDPHLARIREAHEEEDHADAYLDLEAEFFALFQEDPSRFRRHLYDFIIRNEEQFVTASEAELAEA